MPYTWSLNNAALAESMHAILANWQAGRTDEAFHLFKSEIISSMYLGGSPGNITQISYYDAIRGEAYRDFGDPVGMFSRALVEGLFGIVPDALNNTITIRPGLPADWNYASFATPDISFDFKRTGRTDNYTIIPTFPKSLNLKFRAIAQGQVQRVTVNGKAVNWKNLPDAVGKPVIEIVVPAGNKYVISINWTGVKPVLPPAEKIYTPESVIHINIAGATVMKLQDPQQALMDVTISSSGISAQIPGGSLGQDLKRNYTVFAQIQHGALSWWMPICFTVVPPISLVSANRNESNSNTFRLQNNTDKNITTSVSVNAFTKSISINAGKTSDEINVSRENLITGTNAVNIRLPDSEVITTELINWTASTNKRTESIDLSPCFNDKVTQIFKNKYLAPRPPVTTLQLPWQGTGDWPHPLEIHNIDDSGLRKLAGEKNSITLPQGISFSTPGDAAKNNIVFTSQWDNYPKQISVPLSGNASHAWLLMAGSTNPMQSRIDNGSIVVEYTDGTTDSLSLRNPDTWWPIEKDYYSDGFAFALQQPRPIRIHLKTGAIVAGEESKIRYNGREIDGGAATVLDLPLDNSKTLKQLTVKTIANDVVIGLMAVTLLRE